MVRFYIEDNVDLEVKLNNKLIGLSKYVLRKAKDINESKEFGIIWNIITDERCYIKGTESEIQINSTEESKTLLSMSGDNSLVFIHNHSSNNFYLLGI